MSLSGAQLDQLHQALLTAFTEPELRRLVRFELNEDLDQIAGGSDLSDRAYNLATWTDREGRVPDLIAGALRRKPRNADLTALAAATANWDMTATTATSTPLPAQSAPARTHRALRTWLLGGLAVLLLLLLVISLNAQYQPLACAAFKAEDQQVVIKAAHYHALEAGREHSIGWLIRSGVDIAWQETMSGTMQALPNVDDRNTISETNGPAMIYAIDFLPSQNYPKTYNVFVRGYGVKDGQDDEGNADSIHIGLDGRAVTTDVAGGFALLDDTNTPAWMSYNGHGQLTTVEVPSAGIHRLYIWMRENGVVVDKLWLSAAEKGVTVENGDVSLDPPESGCRARWQTWFD